MRPACYCYNPENFGKRNFIYVRSEKNPTKFIRPQTKSRNPKSKTVKPRKTPMSAKRVDDSVKSCLRGRNAEITGKVPYRSPHWINNMQQTSRTVFFSRPNGAVFSSAGSCLRRKQQQTTSQLSNKVIKCTTWQRIWVCKLKVVGVPEFWCFVSFLRLLVFKKTSWRRLRTKIVDLLKHGYSSARSMWKLEGVERRGSKRGKLYRTEMMVLQIK